MPLIYVFFISYRYQLSGFTFAGLNMIGGGFNNQLHANLRRTRWGARYAGRLVQSTILLYNIWRWDLLQFTGSKTNYSRVVPDANLRTEQAGAWVQAYIAYRKLINN